MRSSISDAITALVSALNAAGVPARDGAIVSDLSAAEAVVIGWISSDDGSAVVQGTATVEGATPLPLHESYTIRCAVLVTNGNATMLPQARDRACELYGQVGQTLGDDPTLGSVVTLANLADFTLAQEQTGAGAGATLTFGIGVDAYTRT